MANLRTGRKSGFITRGGVSRRETVWFGDVYTNTAVAAANTAVLLSSLNAAALALRPFTIVRTRGQLSIRTDQTAATEQQVGSDTCYGWWIGSLVCLSEHVQFVAVRKCNGLYWT